ncbi:MAG TPA: biotin/lipoyl-containing protein [Thermoanaerobaculia bacterium]|nr:biotin/lipoyl-containing protein [Thermoanaerobaculia bacterium]
MSEKIVTIGGRQAEITVEKEGNRYRAAGGEIELVALRDDEAEIRTGDRTFVVPYAIDGTRVSFAFDGEIYSADVVEKGVRSRVRHRDHSMAAPMPGLVLKILVRAGDVVTKGTPLVVLEAMKMEHQVLATHDGSVRAVNCVEGEQVQPGLDLVELQPTVNG